MAGVAVKVTGVPAQTPVEPPVELIASDAVTTGSTVNEIFPALPVVELPGVGQA